MQDWTFEWKTNINMEILVFPNAQVLRGKNILAASFLVGTCESKSLIRLGISQNFKICMDLFLKQAERNVVRFLNASLKNSHNLIQLNQSDWQSSQNFKCYNNHLEFHSFCYYAIDQLSGALKYLQFEVEKVAGNASNTKPCHTIRMKCVELKDSLT